MSEETTPKPPKDATTKEVNAPRLVLCVDCVHWNGERSIDPEFPLRPVNEEYRDGECSQLQYELEIDLHTGWDGGTVRSIKTVATFGCAYGKSISENVQGDSQSPDQ